MKVFISWSGEKSKAAASALHDWLPRLIDALEPWMSEEDIEAGSVPMSAIAEALQGSRFGIVVVTPENFNRPWINFEAGAISKHVGELKARVAPLLIGYEKKTDLPGPLSNYQVTLPTKEDFRKLLTALNNQVGLEGEKQKTEPLLSDALDQYWPRLEAKLKEIQEADPTVADQRNEPDLLVEVLGVVRGLQAEIAEIRRQLPIPTGIRSLRGTLFGGPTGGLAGDQRRSAVMEAISNIMATSGFPGTVQTLRSNDDTVEMTFEEVPSDELFELLHLATASNGYRLHVVVITPPGITQQ
jgi:TIR domain